MVKFRSTGAVVSDATRVTMLDLVAKIEVAAKRARAMFQAEIVNGGDATTPRVDEEASAAAAVLSDLLLEHGGRIALRMLAGVGNATLVQIRGRDSKTRRGDVVVEVPGLVHVGRVAIVSAASIALIGARGRAYMRQGLPVPAYARWFNVGDVAEHSSYNLSYTGKIKSVSESCVVIDTGDGDGRTKRLNLDTFDYRNWDFDAAEVAKRNAEAMQSM